MTQAHHFFSPSICPKSWGSTVQLSLDFAAIPRSAAKSIQVQASPVLCCYSLLNDLNLLRSVSLKASATTWCFFAATSIQYTEEKKLQPKLVMEATDLLRFRSSMHKYEAGFKKPSAQPFRWVFVDFFLCTPVPTNRVIVQAPLYVSFGIKLSRIPKQNEQYTKPCLLNVIFGVTRCMESLSTNH